MEIREHNLIAYNRVKQAFKNTNKACVVHATGTGKSYIALQLIRDRIKTDKILYITSYEQNLEMFRQKTQKYFPEDYQRIEFALYPGLGRIINSDMRFSSLILDEFHRVGAEIWGNYVDVLLTQNPEAKVLGLTATPIRYLDNERDMSDELFDGNVVSELNLRDALLQQMLPAPNYYTCVYSFMDDLTAAERRIHGLKEENTKQRAMLLLEKAKRMIENASGLDRFFLENMESFNGKYIVFCRNYQHMKLMEQESISWFPGAEIHQYEMYSIDRKSKSEFDAFQADHSDTLRLCFCISMLNEGVHVKGIDGVILLRPTESLNVYYQQIGRALSISTCESPKIYDIVGNIATLQPVKSFWNGIQNEFTATGDFDFTFSIYGRDIEILAYLTQLSDITRTKTWDEVYQIAERYAKEHEGTIGNIKRREKYEEYGLGEWIAENRKRYAKQQGITAEQIKKLENIGMIWNTALTWNEWYKLAAEYVRENGPISYNTIYKNKKIGVWWTNQKKIARGNCKKYIPLTETQKQMLKGIGMNYSRKQADWSKEETDILVRYFPTEGINCCKRLEGKSTGAITSKARAMKIPAPHSHTCYSEEEIRIIKEKGAEHLDELLIMFPWRKKNALISKMRELGIYENHFIRWTEQEDEIIRNYYPTEGNKVCFRLPGRNSQTCKARAVALGVKKSKTK